MLDFGIADALLGDNPITLDSLCFGAPAAAAWRCIPRRMKNLPKRIPMVASEDEGKEAAR